MNISREQLEKLKDKDNKTRKRVEDQKSAVTKILIGCVVLFVIGIAVAFANIVVGIILAVLGLGLSLAILYLLIRFDNMTSQKLNHYKNDKVMKTVLGMYGSRYMSRGTFEYLNEMLIEEKDPRRAGYIRSLVSDMFFIKGDLDGFRRSLFEDKELFSIDPYYELIYERNILAYYTFVNSTTGGTEYAEEAYRNFMHIFDRSKRLQNDLGAAKLTLEAVFLISYLHKDMMLCNSTRKLLIEYFYSGENLSGADRAHVKWLEERT